jgi:hypothetical protein
MTPIRLIVTCLGCLMIGAIAASIGNQALLGSRAEAVRGLLAIAKCDGDNWIIIELPTGGMFSCHPDPFNETPTKPTYAPAPTGRDPKTSQHQTPAS